MSARFVDVSDRLPAQTWKPFSFSALVDVPFSCRDEWGRDVIEATLVGADPDFDLTTVPIELVERVRMDGNPCRIGLAITTG